MALLKGMGAVGECVRKLVQYYVGSIRVGSSFSIVERRTGFSRKVLSRIAKDLRKLAKETKILVTYGLDEYPFAPVALYHLADGAKQQKIPTPSGVWITTLDAFAIVPQSLTLLADVIPTFPAPGMQDGSFDDETGRTYQLFAAAVVMTKALGAPHYPELALLVELLHMGFGTTKTVEPATIAKAVRDYKSRNPSEAEAVEARPLEDLVEEYLEILPEFPWRDEGNARS